MSKKALRLDEIGYWSEVKLDIMDANMNIFLHDPSKVTPAQAGRMNAAWGDDSKQRSPLMATNSHIEWTEATWNPMTGCDKVSPGCAHCYAERMARRLQAMGQRNYANGFELTLQPQMLELPLRWKRSKRIFVNSMSDMFHADVPLTFIQQAFDVMRRADWHQFQVLTKRSERLRELDAFLNWQPNIWMGVSVENARFVHRIEDLRNTRAHVKFLSLEPLLAPLSNLDLRGIDWVIVGGESGPHARPMESSWVLDIRNQCQAAGVAFLFKQWGGVFKSRMGRELEGRTWNQMPDEVRPS